MKDISCIICAYNEGPRIGSVLAVAAGHPLLREVIVVDDGSRDGTARVALSFPGVRVIRLEKNSGKSIAMAEGVRAARGALLLLLDADLRHLTAENIAALAMPVLSGEAEVSVSLRGSSWHVGHITSMDILTGERVIPRELLLRALSHMRGLPGFGIEIFINRLIIKRRLRLAVVRWNNVFHTSKGRKYGWWRGTRAQFKMISDICTAHTPVTPITQMYSLFMLRSDLAWKRWLEETSRELVRSGFYDTTGNPPKSSF